MSTMTFGGLNPSTGMVFGGLNTEGTTPAPTVGAPGAPNLTLTAGDGQALAQWSVTNDGGSPITGWQYRIYATGDTAPSPTQVAPGVLTNTFTGLSNDTEYTVQVAAINALGTSAWTTQAVTPSVPARNPGQVTGLVLTPLDSAARITFNAPADPGTSAITGYRVTVIDGQTYTYTLSTTLATLMALPNDVQLSVSVVAVTSDGESSPVTGFVAPTENPAGTTPPGAPTALVPTARNGSATLSWTAPASFGTYALSDYLIHAVSGDSDRWYSSTTTTAELGDLANDIAWNLTVVARTGAGSSEESPQVSVTPFTGGAIITNVLVAHSTPPISPTPGSNPVYPENFVPDDPGGIEEPPPPPVFVPIPAPNIFAFYPVGENGSLGAFSPDNWAGL